MKASIIIRAFNEEKHLKQLLDKIFSQEVSFEYEIILVDSGSTDETLSIASSYKVTIVHINPRDFTFGYSLNKGIEKSTGEFCAMISAHCIPKTNYWLEELLKPFLNKKVAIVYGRQEGSSETAYSEHRIFHRWFPLEDIEDSELAFCNNANSAIRRSLWEEYKFDETLTGLEDLDWAKYVKREGYQIYYKMSASVFHIHEQSPKQIFNRYYREAFAYRQIYRDEHFSFWDFLSCFIMNWGGDYLHSIKDGLFCKNIFSIPLFRFLQFFGTYRAHQYKISINNAMKRRLYYPDKPRFFDKANAYLTPIRDKKSDYIDITREISEDLPAWPGTDVFTRKKIKNWQNDKCRDSTFSMNAHLGTHIDAPSHNIENGITIDKIKLDRFFGEVFVIEFLEEGPIDLAFLKTIKIPKRIDQIIFKTKNSEISYSMFQEKFVALSKEAALWLSNKNIKLIGIDGPSIQGFYEPTSEIHEILLKNEIIILENLDLHTVPSGVYDLIVLPLKIKNIEASPVRALLKKKES